MLRETADEVSQCGGARLLDFDEQNIERGPPYPLGRIVQTKWAVMRQKGLLQRIALDIGTAAYNE